MPLRKRLTTFPSMISLGRTPNNDLVVDDAQISKFHASFRFRGSALEVEDAGSANGTYVGRQAITKGTPHPLRRGDVIRFGALSFELYDAAGAYAWLTDRV
jgi:pSer/pThr/pTyr-binding forkhead associated (FHA) protein